MKGILLSLSYLNWFPRIMPTLKPLLTLLIVLFCSTGWGQGLKPDNDDCQNAIPLHIGQYLANISNSTATVSHPLQAPKTIPATCIQTLENDLWYSFTTEDKYAYYEVVIIAKACNTPAGLQAMLIRSDDCNSEHYLYRACSNKQTMDTIKLFMRNPGAGQRHLIYVDGYDGTICDFDIWLRGREYISPLDYRYLRYDYDLSEVPYGLPPQLETGFRNNMAFLSWTGSAEKEVAYYVVERFMDQEDLIEGSEYLQVVGIIDPRNFAGSGEVWYEFEDFISSFEQGEDYRYRIVSVDMDGGREVSEDITIKARLIEDFFVSEVKNTPEENVFAIIYINKRKKQDFYLSVTNEAGEVVKETRMEGVKEPDGEVTMHMEEFPAGTYYFKMGNGKESFVRSFQVN